MLVLLKADISGTRDGLNWPPRGATMELPDDEAAQYCAAGLAVPVKRSEEKAVMAAAEVETRGPVTTDAAPLVPGTTRRKVSRTTEIEVE